MYSIPYTRVYPNLKLMLLNRSHANVFLSKYLGLAVFVLQTVNGFFDHLNVNVVLSFFNHNQFLGYFLENKWGKVEFSLQHG